MIVVALSGYMVGWVGILTDVIGFTTWVHYRVGGILTDVSGFIAWVHYRVGGILTDVSGFI